MVDIFQYLLDGQMAYDRSLLINPPAGDYPQASIVQQDYTLYNATNCKFKHKFINDLKGDFQHIYMKPPRNRLQQKEWLAYCTHLLSENGTLFTVQENRAGAKSLQKDCEAICQTIAVETKKKGRFITASHPIQQPLADRLRHISDINAYSAPGLFAWDRVDQGSLLLMAHLPPHINGIVADFGCGWGALSRFILENEAVNALHSIDSDALAIEAITKNIKETRLHALWGDATQHIPTITQCDFIIMNPPFHRGSRIDDSDLGASMIKNAHHHLKAGGELWLVANAHLPYETIIDAHYQERRIITEQDGYKIIAAKRP